ncbi:MAG: hypothetical protein EXS64_21125 [Candidatus Latescibacteria bacterium]|nr:hypothetical protein [Candidatus Latescibacterota bacterium]
MEPVLNRPVLSPDQRRRILSRLVAAETFERFLHSKYIGQKRFSVEGGEALLPLLDTLVEDGAGLGAEEVVIGMAHRGRINVLTHILHKPYEMILSEFEGTLERGNAGEGDGDVKYHKGFSCDHVTVQGRRVHLSLSSNPSHLEQVNPIVLGTVYAKQAYLKDQIYLKDMDYNRVVPVLIHGEAAFTGQGIVPEILSLSQLEGYRIGGTIHIIINNQVGFTSTPNQTRFTPYPTDVAKMVRAPVFHVNGDDPEAVVHAARLAMAFRQEFKGDVLIDLWCYRRHGHNETDEPTFTQPVMYREIEAHPSACELYGRRLAEEGVCGPTEVEEMRGQVRQRLEAALSAAREEHVLHQASTLGGRWKGLTRAGDDWSARTAVASEVLRRVGERAAWTPPGFKVHPKLRRLLAVRLQMAQGRQPVDWAGAECWPSGACCWRRSRSAWQARTPSGGPSASGTRCCTTSRRGIASRPWRTWPRTRPPSRS